MKKISLIYLIGMLVATSSSAQQLDVPRSRHVGDIGTCGSCMPGVDGAIHFRFSPSSAIVTEDVGGTPQKRLNLVLEIRGSKKMTERPQLLDAVSTGVNYNETTFGPNLYTPAWLNVFGSPLPGAQCTVTRGLFMAGSASYTLVLTDDASSTLGITETTDFVGNDAASPNAFATLPNTYGNGNFITIKCDIVNEDTEADISFTAQLADANSVRLIDMNDAVNPIIRRSIVLVADNDLRGFRLDGKTWAEDYSRFSNGMGVRLKFSKGVYADDSGTKKGLTTDNFIVYDSNGSTDTIAINDIVHTAGDPYVTLKVSADSDTNNPAVGAVVRLVSGSQGAFTVKDTDGEDLADGNFVASLEYDEDAPQVSSITPDTSFSTAQQSRWMIGFNSPIHADTAIKENVCLTKLNGACAAADAAPTTPSIASVIAGTPDDTKTDGMVSTMTVVVNEGMGKTGGMRSIEFRRNAIFAGNLYIAEDYQTELRDEIQLTNRQGPVITVTDASLTPNPKGDGDYLNYNVSFTVTADEDVPSLDETSSYGLRYLQGTNLLTTLFSEDSVNIIPVIPDRKVTIVYNVTFNTAGIVRGMRQGGGMVLVRGSAATSLEDEDTPSLGPNENTNDGTPELASGARLDPDSLTAIARNPVVSAPVITAVADGDARVESNARQYRGSFTVTVGEDSQRVPDIGDPDSYVLLREADGDSSNSLEAVSTSLPTIDSVSLTAGTVTTKTAVINFDVTLALLDDARATRYFTLGRGSDSVLLATELLDIYSNIPVRSDNTAIDSGARITFESNLQGTGKTSQANRVGKNARLSVVATAANPAANNPNQYSMTFTVTARDADGADGDPLELSDIGDLSAYKLRHLVNSGTALDLTSSSADLDLTSSSNRFGAGSTATLSYTVTFPDTLAGIANARRTTGFTLEYADNSKLLSGSGDFPARSGDAGNTGVLSEGDRIDNRATAEARRDTGAPYLAITNDPTGSVATADGGASYTFSFTVAASDSITEESEPVQDLLEVGSYTLLVAGREADIGNDNLTDTTISPTTAAAVSGQNNTVRIDYQVALSDIRVLPAFSSEPSTKTFVPYGFLLARANDEAFLDASNNKPVQVDAAGDPTATELTSDNTVQSVLQLGKVAILDQDAPVITLTADTGAEPVNNRWGVSYQMTFTVRANEPVTGIGNASSYNLMRVLNNNTVVGQSNHFTIEGNAPTVTAVTAQSATFTYTVLFGDSQTGRNRARGTQGFTLALVGGALKDVANNRPVDTATPAVQIYGDDDAVTAARQGVIPPTPANAAPSVMALRDTTRPSVTVAPRGSFASPSNTDPTVYSGSFTVSATGNENIRDIGTGPAYQLLRIPTGGGTPVVVNGATLTSTSAQDGTSAIIAFSGANVGTITVARATAGFTLAADTTIAENNQLRDYSANLVTVGAQNRLDAASSAVLARDMSAPTITVSAFDADGDGVFAEPIANDGSAYTMTFKVDAVTEDVPALNMTSSYRLLRVKGNQRTVITPATSRAGAWNPVKATTLTYTVTGITDPTEIDGFTLTTANADSLADRSGNPLGISGTTPIDTADTAIAYRDRTAPTITVAAFDADGDGVFAEPTATDGSAYTMTFKVIANEDVPTLNTTSSYSLLRVKGNIRTVITPATSRAGSWNPSRGTTLTYTVTGITDPTDIDGFTLTIAAADSLVDKSGNPRGITAPTPIDTASTAIAYRDRTPPFATVVAAGTSPKAMPDTPNDGTAYAMTFNVTLSEAVSPAIEERTHATSNFKLARIFRDGTAADFPTAAIFPPDFAVSGNQLTVPFIVANLTDPTNIRGFTLAANTAAPNLTDYSGNPLFNTGSNTLTRIAPDDILDESSGALADRDITPPQIRLGNNNITDIAGDATGSYNIQFQVSSVGENVQDLNDAGSYRLVRIRGNDSLDAASFSTVLPERFNTNTADRSYTAIYNVNIMTRGNLSRADIRDTKGFTLARVGTSSLIDYSGNPPVKEGTTTPISPIGGGSDSEVLASLIGGTSGGVVASNAVVTRDDTPPEITVRASTSTVVDVSGNNITLNGTFTVEATKNILGIGLNTAYLLLRQVNGNFSGESAAILTRTSGNDNGNRAVFDYSYTFTGTSARQDLRDTTGFTLGRADAAAASDSLIDYASNTPEDPGSTSIPKERVETIAQRLDSRNKAVSKIDKSAPVITVTALTTGDATATRNTSDRSINEYTMRFSINSNKAVRDIGDPMAYTLMRIPSGGGAAVAITTTGTRVSGEDSQREATITFIGQFTAAEITNEQDTVAFTLGRASDADTGRCRLCSLESSQPTRGGDDSNPGSDIVAGARIDDSAGTTVSRDRTAPQIAVESDGNLEQPTGSDIAGVTSGIQTDGAFHVRFKLEGDYSDIPDIVDALTPGFQSGFRVLRKHSGSNTFSVVNRRGQGAQPVLPVVSACREVQGTNIVTIPDCYHIGVGDAILSASDAANTDYFTLGRGSGRLRDGSNNDPIVFGSNTVVRAVGDVLGPLPLSSTPTANLSLERNKPWSTVVPSQFARIGDQICGSFEVSARDSNSNSEPIDGINEAGSYRLLRINPNGTVTGLTTAGSANERCEGAGSVISRVTPEVTNVNPNPSLLTATIYFNVMDTGVTTQHKYTLGRQAKLTDISGNALVDNALPRTTEITTTADATGRIDSRDAALGDIPSGDTTNPIITATVIDIEAPDGDGVEAMPSATDPLTFSGRFRVEVQQPDDGEENVARINSPGAYRVVYVSIDNNQEVAITSQTITISNVTPNRAATVDFTATLPNLTAVQDVAGFKLRPVNLVDSGGNSPLNNEFSGDNTEARRDGTAPSIKVVADSTAVALADNGTQYEMTFTVSSVGNTPEDVRNLDDASAYRLMRVGGSPFDLTVTNVDTAASSNKRSAEFTYTVMVNNQIEDITGFTLARASDIGSLIDRSGNAPVRGGTTNNGSDIPVNARIDNDSGAVATRETTPPQITITATDQAATADANDNYTMQFTVSATEDVATLGDLNSYILRRIQNDNSLEHVPAQSMSATPVTANRQYMINYVVNLSSLGVEEIRNTRGFTLLRGSTATLIDRSGNRPVKGDGTTAIGEGGFIAAVSEGVVVATGVAARETSRPRIEVRAVLVDGFGAIPHPDVENRFIGSFTVRSAFGLGIGEPIKGLGATGNYQLLRELVLGIDDAPLPSMLITGSDDPAATTSVVISFQANFLGTQAEIDEAIRSTDGFTLAAASLNMYDYASNLPQGLSVGNRLDNHPNAVAKRDRNAPQITVVAGNAGNAVADETDPLVYTGSFTVTAPEGKPITSLATTASYKVLRISLTDAPLDVDNVTIIERGTGNENEAVFDFTATLADITAVQGTKGFTLGYAANLQDSSNNLPAQFGNGRLDAEDAALASRDTTLPKITVVAQGEVVEEDINNNTRYTIVFDVSADERIRNINADSSYQLLRIDENLGDVTASGATIGVTAAQANASTATVTASIELTDAVVGATSGFTLARGGDVAALRDMASNDPVDAATSAAVAPGGRLDSRSAAEAGIITVRVECAPFYPNIGQQDLFLRITSESALNLNGLTLMQGGTTLFGNTDTAEPSGTVGEFAIVKADLGSEITDSASISVSYADAERTVDTSCAIDNLANLTDSDSDGVNDIVDRNPYDGVAAINLTVAKDELDKTPASTDTFYNRHVLVRSLLRGEEFTYVENGETDTAGGTALTAAQYFGIDYAPKTHLLAVANGSACASILAVAKANKLSQVNLNAFCASEDLGAAEDYDFLNEVSITEKQRYVWVGVDTNGRLQPSEYPDHTISALPEINISGQSSYFYAAPPATPKNIIISAYAPDATNTSIDLTVKGTVVSGDPIADGSVTLMRSAGPQAGVYIGPKVYSWVYPVTGDGKNPQAGQTIRHWLTDTGSNNVWHATEAKLKLPKSGGYTEFDDAKYAIGDSSYVDVRMAKDGTAEPITQIDYLVLSDVTESPGTTASIVTSVVQGRYYYLTAGLTTNIADISTETRVAAMKVDGYTILDQVVEQEGSETIGFQVNSGDDVGDTITVGWDKIGTAENVLATYRVMEDIPAGSGYNRPGPSDDLDNADTDGDRIRNGLDEFPDSPYSLQVAVDGAIDPNNDWLSVVGWFDQPLYASGDGLIIAASKGDDMEIDYSAANIEYGSLTTGTKMQLGFTDDDDDTIISLATFGIRSVNYGFSQEENADAMIVGGVAYAVFPIEAGMPDQPLYISRYNDEAGRWERFERGTHRDSPADTWYVIDRESNTFCPLDVGIYRNEHMTTGTDNMGFTANNQKCVLMAITDGGPYDNSDVDGIIDALFAMGTELQSRSQGLQCAAFYPNVGQKELFFELDGIGFAANGFAITQDGNPLMIDSATQTNPGAGEDVDPIVKVTLGADIVSLADIMVTYTVAGEDPSETMCVASLDEDTDEDKIPDIADENPIDPGKTGPNPNAGERVGNDVLFVKSDVPFYSRNVVVRSLLRGEAFDYIEENEDGKPIPMTHTGTMTPAQYFGVAADARIYEYSMMCEDILAAAQADGLRQVKIDEFCTEDITNDFVNVINNDFVEDGSDGPDRAGHRYLWATVSNGLLVSSYIGEPVRILPEINFLGQDTYLFVGPTSKTVVISAYVGNFTERVNIPVKGASQDAESDFSETDNDVHLEIPTRPKDEGTILTEHDITSHGEHPQPGETITRWLSGSSSIWQPMEETLAPVEGGIDPRNYMYAIGTHNHIDIRVADPETDAPITEIRQVLLYEVTDSDPPIRRVTSMVAKGTYYVAVDFDTNIQDIENQIEVAAQHIDDLYEDITDDMMTTATQHIATVRETDFEKEELAIIVIEVAGDVNTTSVITVGWNKVGSVNNVISRYLVTTGGTHDYTLVDADFDGIPDDHDRHGNNNNLLQISIGGSPIDPNEDFLTTQDGNPTFLTYEGIVIADALNSDGGIKAINYSVVNNGDLTDDTQLLLDISINTGEGGDEIDTIATFGVAGVEYGFEPEGNGFKPTGGVVYASFPIFVDQSDETLYLGKYNSEAGRWVRFERERSDYADTWYAIDRPSTGACPTDVQVYQNQHQAAGDGNGFIAGSNGNCLMLVLTDGGPYDSSGLDSRVLDPLSVGTKEFDTYREEQRRRGGGGGGAIGVSDILLLIGALVLITLASRKRRRIY